MNIFKQNRVLILLVIVIAIGAILIGPKFSAKKEVKPSNLTKVSVALEWFPYANHVGLFIAKDKGYFAQEGLDVDLHTPADPSTVLQTVASGRDDFGISTQIDVSIARTKSIPVVSIMAFAQHPISSVLTLVESGITQPRDLAGKKVGTPGYQYFETLLDTMLKHDGVSSGIKEVQLVDVGYDVVSALISKKVDAILAYWTTEFISATNQGFPVNIMRVEQHGVPDYYELVLVTNEKTISEKKDLVQKFVRAVKRGYKDAIADPQAGVKLMKKLKPEVDLAIESKGVDLFASFLWVPENKIFGWQEKSKWINIANWMKDNGLVSKTLDPKSAFDNSFVENASKK